jgi:prepilin-type processing-associated H-X9-DG protein
MKTSDRHISLERAINFGLLVMFGVFVCWLLLPQVGSHPITSRSMCKSNLKQIYLALENYHNDYKSLPPAVVYDAQGRPMHSWRVLLLPYLGLADVYNRYRFDEPWNSPHNRQLEIYGRDFQCPDDEKRDPEVWNTSYVACVGKGTLWPPQGAGNLDDIRDDRDTTIMLVERSRSNIHWMEPADWGLSRAPGTSGGVVRSEHRGDGANALFVDGSVQFISTASAAETLAAMATIAGDEVVRQDFQASGPPTFVLRAGQK